VEYAGACCEFVDTMLTMAREGEEGEEGKRKT